MKFLILCFIVADAASIRGGGGGLLAVKASPSAANVTAASDAFNQALTQAAGLSQAAGFLGGGGGSVSPTDISTLLSGEAAVTKAEALNAAANAALTNAAQDKQTDAAGKPLDAAGNPISKQTDAAGNPIILPNPTDGTSGGAGANATALSAANVNQALEVAKAALFAAQALSSKAQSTLDAIDAASLSGVQQNNSSGAPGDPSQTGDPSQSGQGTTSDAGIANSTPANTSYTNSMNSSLGYGRAFNESNSAPWVLASTQNKEVYIVKANSLEQIGGRLESVSVGKGVVWALSDQGYPYKCWAPCKGDWRRMSGQFKTLNAGYSEVWAVDLYGRVFRRFVEGSSWDPWRPVPLAPTVVKVSVCTDKIFAVDGKQNAWSCAFPCMNSWVMEQQMTKYADKYLSSSWTSFVAGNKEVWAINKDYNVFKRDLIDADPMGWSYVPGLMKTLSITESGVYGVRAGPPQVMADGTVGDRVDGDLVQCDNPCSGNWTPMTGASGATFQTVSNYCGNPILPRQKPSGLRDEVWGVNLGTFLWKSVIADNGTAMPWSSAGTGDVASLGFGGTGLQYVFALSTDNRIMRCPLPCTGDSCRLPCISNLNVTANNTANGTANGTALLIDKEEPQAEPSASLRDLSSTDFTAFTNLTNVANSTNSTNSTSSTKTEGLTTETNTKFIQFDAGPDALWAIRTDNTVWSSNSRLDQMPIVFQRSPAPVPMQSLSITKNGDTVVFATSFRSKNLYRYDSSGWQLLDNSSNWSQISTGKDALWGITDKGLVLKRPYSEKYTFLVRGRFTQIAEGSSAVFGLSARGGMFRCALPCNWGDWQKIPGQNLTSFSVNFRSSGPAGMQMPDDFDTNVNGIPDGAEIRLRTATSMADAVLSAAQAGADAGARAATLAVAKLVNDIGRQAGFNAGKLTALAYGASSAGIREQAQGLVRDLARTTTRPPDMPGNAALEAAVDMLVKPSSESWQTPGGFAEP